MTNEQINRDRNTILAKYADLYKQQFEWMMKAEDPEWAEQDALSALKKVNDEMMSVVEQYRNMLGYRALSRCPFTGQVMEHSIDDVGMDGLWWNHENPVRLEEKPHPTYFGLSGAMMLLGEPADVPFLCCPGPKAPFVLPRLLNYDQIKAVLSSWKIGEHRVFLVFYFAEPIPADEPRPNEYGMSGYRFYDIDGEKVFGEYSDFHRSFDLAEWISAGKLLWIAPDDQTLQLRSVTMPCPYLAMEVDTKEQFIQNGKVWTQEMEDTQESSLSDEEFATWMEEFARDEAKEEGSA